MFQLALVLLLGLGEVQEVPPRVPRRPSGIVGSIVDKDGDLIRGKVTVAALIDDGTRQQEFAVAAGGSHFRLPELPQGELRLRATSEVWGTTTTPPIAHRAGELERVNIVFEEADTSRTMMVRLRPLWKRDDPLESAWVRAQAPDGSVLYGERIESSERCTFAFKHAPHASYDIFVGGEPSLREQTKEDVKPGEVTTIVVQQAAVLALDVREAGAAREVLDYAARILVGKSVTLRAAGTPRPVDGLYANVPIRNAMLIVEAEGYHTEKLGLGMLVPGQINERTVTLRRKRWLSGWVREANGRPAVGVDVHLTGSTVKRRRTSRTDTEGMFRFDGLDEARYSVRATASCLLSASVTVELAEDRSDVLIDLPPTAMLSGTVSGLDGGASLEVGPPWFDGPPVRTTVGRKGRYRLSGLPLGSCQIWVVTKDGKVSAKQPLGVVHIEHGENEHDFVIE